MSSTETSFGVIASICDYLNAVHAEYDVPNDADTVFCTLVSDVFPCRIMFTVTANEHLLTYCELPFSVPRRRMDEFVLLLNAANTRLSCGKFCLYGDTAICSFESCEILGGLKEFSRAYGQALVQNSFSALNSYGKVLWQYVHNKCTYRDALAGFTCM